MNVFNIENLRCSYKKKGDTVVFIENLQIPKGKMTVILGRSGSGKSTLIEALGLMNNTIQEGSVQYFSPDGEIDLAQIWKKSETVAKIRKNHYSFIFQDDYLMPHYTCSENMLIARLIQGNIDTRIAKGLQDHTMAGLNLTDKDIKRRYPFEVAGGQKQRLSFTRAVLKEFDILFGDEPTGNLDYKNSNDLFEFIRSILGQKQRSALIVSHNIELSVEKADKIIVLTPSADQTRSFFEMKSRHVFHRGMNNEWMNFPEPEELVKFIQSIL
ncbi:MAG: ATP-binding cassette domain-containing protein [Bacteroidales bacterium]